MPFYLMHGASRGQPFIHETNLARASFDETVEILARQDFSCELTRVSCVDLEAGTVTDESLAIAEAVAQRSIERRDAPMSDLRAFLDAQGVRYYEEPDENVFEMAPRGLRRAA